MKQKHFIDIKHANFEATEYIDVNTQAFEVGDEIVIQTKVDGANSCICYDEENDSLACFSSRNELSFNNTLRGFWDKVQLMDKTPFKNNPTWRVFGEHLVSHTIRYNSDAYNKWYVYDIFDTATLHWQPQSVVKKFCEEYGFTYVHTYYSGPFINWEHVKSFLKKPVYGEQLEGIVIKNQTKLNDENNGYFPYLKIVNPQFKEIQDSNRKNKVVDPEKLKAMEKAQEIVDIIVTQPRVEKQIRKMVDEGVLPEKMTPQDMKIVAQNLPKRIYEDCVKEHENMVIEAGEYFGKLCSSKTMAFAKNIILGAK